MSAKVASSKSRIVPESAATSGITLRAPLPALKFVTETTTVNTAPMELGSAYGAQGPVILHPPDLGVGGSPHIFAPTRHSGDIRM